MRAFNESRTIKTIDRLSALGVFLLAVVTFWLSYNSLRALAAENGFAGLDWLWPLSLDAGVVVFSLALLRAALLGDSKRFCWSMVIFLDGASIIFNILHAPQKDYLAQSMAALPPLVLLFALRALETQIESNLRRGYAVGTIAELQKSARDQVARQRASAAKLEAQTAELNALNQKISEAKAALKTQKKAANSTGKPTKQGGKKAKIKLRRQKILQLVEDGKPDAEIRDELQISQDTLRRDKQAVMQNGTVK